MRLNQKLVRRLCQDQAGAAAIEFALVMPILLMFGMYGIELANMASVDMQVSQMAVSVADNASRLGQTTNTSVAPTINENDVDSVMFGASRQGRGIDITNKGRIVLSSLERDSASGKQFIHWQRCHGGKTGHRSAYGNDSSNNGLNGGNLVSMGRGTNKVTASNGTAVMFAEVYYDYEGLFGTLFVNNTTFVHEAAFIVRDSRDLRGSGQSGLTGGGGNSRC